MDQSGKVKGSGSCDSKQVSGKDMVWSRRGTSSLGAPGRDQGFRRNMVRVSGNRDSSSSVEVIRGLTRKSPPSAALLVSSRSGSRSSEECPRDRLSPRTQGGGADRQGRLDGKLLRECRPRSSSPPDGFSRSRGRSRARRSRQRACQGSSSSFTEKDKQKVGEAASERDGGKSKMESSRNPFGSHLQETYKGEGEKGKIQQFQHHSNWQSIRLLRGWPGYRTQVKVDLAPPAGLPHPLLRQRGEACPSRSLRRRSSEHEGLQPLLQTDDSPKGRATGSTARDGYPEQSFGHGVGGGHLAGRRRDVSKAQMSQVDTTGDGRQLGNASRTSTQRTIGPDGGQRSQLCSEEILGREKIGESIERQPPLRGEGLLVCSLGAEGSQSEREEGIGQRKGQTKAREEGLRGEPSSDSSDLKEVKVHGGSLEKDIQEAVDNLIEKSRLGADEFLLLGARPPEMSPGLGASPDKVTHLPAASSHGDAAAGRAAVVEASEPRRVSEGRATSLVRLISQVSDLLPGILKDERAKRVTSMEGIFPLPLPPDWSSQSAKF